MAEVPNGVKISGELSMLFSMSMVPEKYLKIWLDINFYIPYIYAYFWIFIQL